MKFPSQQSRKPHVRINMRINRNLNIANEINHLPLEPCKDCGGWFLAKRATQVKSQERRRERETEPCVIKSSGVGVERRCSFCLSWVVARGVRKMKGGSGLHRRPLARYPFLILSLKSMAVGTLETRSSYSATTTCSKKGGFHRPRASSFDLSNVFLYFFFYCSFLCAQESENQ